MPKDKYYPEYYADLADQIGGKLVEKLGVGLERAAAIGYEIAEYMRKHHSGGSIYLAKGERYELSLRDKEIYESCNGRNYADLARKYGRTDVRIYQIVKRVRDELIKERQGALF